MNIQIFGTRKSFDTKKAERYFKERSIKYQFIDLLDKSLSKGEFNSVCQALGGYEPLIDENCKDKDLLAIIKYISPEDKPAKILENQKVLKPRSCETANRQRSVISRTSGRIGSDIMVKQIVRDVFFLSQKSEPATKADFNVGYDLMDTLRANRERCVGMAANMIGVRKNVIIVNMGMVDIVMFNPVILKKDTPYETEEGCLSLDGVRPTTRYENIEVEYYDFSWKKQRRKLSGWTAQICQHEIDHLSGRII